MKKNKKKDTTQRRTQVTDPGSSLTRRARQWCQRRPEDTSLDIRERTSRQESREDSCKDRKNFAIFLLQRSVAGLDFSCKSQRWEKTWWDEKMRFDWTNALSESSKESSEEKHQSLRRTKNTRRVSLDKQWRRLSFSSIMSCPIHKCSISAEDWRKEGEKIPFHVTLGVKIRVTTIPVIDVLCSSIEFSVHFACNAKVSPTLTVYRSLLLMIMPDDAKKGVKVMCPSSPSRNAIILLSVRKEEQSTKRERERERQ